MPTAALMETVIKPKMTLTTKVVNQDTTIGNYLHMWNESSVFFKYFILFYRLRKAAVIILLLYI